MAKKKTPPGASPKKHQKKVTRPIPQTPSRSTRGAPAPSKKAQRRQEAKKREIPWFIIGVIGFIVIVLAILIIFRIFSTPPAQAALPPEVSIQEAHQKYVEGAFLLDVREQEEWDQFHVPETTLIPLGELEQRLDELPRDKEIVVICRNGNRSKEGRDILLGAGFYPVTSMAGGVSQWEMLDFPITRDGQ